MRIEFKGRNEEITSRFRQHAEPRLEQLGKHVEKITEILVTLSAQKGWRTVEVTVSLDGQVFRAEKRESEERTAFDKALARVEKQLQRNKDRFVEKHRQPVRVEEEGAPAAEIEEGEVEELPLSIDDIEIARSKSHVLKPMTPAEAVLQMEQIHHDFYVFINGETERVAVVYRRRAGGYGLIEPEAA